MRAGAFAEKRVIDLLNRRFVPFYFNRGGPGEGHDKAAAAFVKGKVKNQYAHFAVFDPKSGDWLAESEIYADKDGIFEFLMKALADRPEFAKDTAAEAAILAKGDLRAASLAEEIGRYADAKTWYTRLVESGAASEEAHEAMRALLRIARYQKDWVAQRSWAERLRAEAAPERQATAAVDCDLELGYALIAEKKYAEARRLLQPTTKAADQVRSRRLAEAHVAAGIACFLGGDRDWAKFHWLFVVENLPEDRHYQRAYICAASDAMPYPNFELAGFEAPVGNIGVEHIHAAVRRAKRIYERLLPLYDQGTFAPEPSPGSGSQGTQAQGASEAPSKAAALVANLKDGNENRIANNKLVDELVALGADALPPLTTMAADATSDGRGYAAWALAKVLEKTGTRPQPAMEALEACTKSADPYVVALSTSGLRVLRAAPQRLEAPAEAPTPSESPESAFLLVARLVDGNEHRLANNRIVAALEKIGRPSIASLIAALGDPKFPGRGYASFALGSVMKANAIQDAAAETLLRSLLEDADPYVVALTRSALSLVEEIKKER